MTATTSGREPPSRAEALRAEVVATYRAVALGAAGRFPYPTGRAGALGLGYEPAGLDAVPVEVLERFVGIGNPFRVRRPAPGERVLDAGCGCGLDALLASRLVGPTGRVVGLDLSPDMLDVARRATASGTPARVEWVEGSIESLPFPDGSFDVVLSNGAMNLVPDKDAAFREIHRVLAPGGTLAAADVLQVDAAPGGPAAPGDWST